MVAPTAQIMKKFCRGADQPIGSAAISLDDEASTD
jgi:hypothetical protein